MMHYTNILLEYRYLLVADAFGTITDLDNEGHYYNQWSDQDTQPHKHVRQSRNSEAVRQINVKDGGSRQSLYICWLFTQPSW